MTMFLLVKSVAHGCYKTGPTRREQRLQEFRFLEFAEESKGHPTDILVWMLKVISNCIAEYQYSKCRIHTRQESSPVSIFHPD
jgi:hypothetical protein